MNRVRVCLLAGACLLHPGSGLAGEWQFSTDVRGAAVSRDDLSGTHCVQPWGVDTVTGATQKTDGLSQSVVADVTAAYVDAGTSGLLGARYIGAWGDSSYAFPRLANAILAWHGPEGSIEGGTVLTPSTWGHGLLVDRLHFSGGRARVNWGGSGRTEVFLTDTVDDLARYRFYDASLAGVQHTAEFAGGAVGLHVLDARRDSADVFPKQGVSRGTFAGAHASYRPQSGLLLFGEGAYGWLTDGAEAQTHAEVAGVRWSLGPDVSLAATGFYLGRGFNPAGGFYNLRGDEQGALKAALPWRWKTLGLEIRPGLGWKQQAADNFWVPSLEMQWAWAAAGLSLKLCEHAEQPWGRWGAEDHWEYTRAALDWQALAPLILSVRWEKIYDGFTHTKSQQLVAEAGVRY